LIVTIITLIKRVFSLTVKEAPVQIVWQKTGLNGTRDADAERLINDDTLIDLIPTRGKKMMYSIPHV